MGSYNLTHHAQCQIEIDAVSPICGWDPTEREPKKFKEFGYFAFRKSYPPLDVVHAYLFDEFGNLVRFGVIRELQIFLNNGTSDIKTFEELMKIPYWRNLYHYNHQLSPIIWPIDNCNHDYMFRSQFTIPKI